MLRSLSLLVLCATTLLALASCGADTEAIEPVTWPYMEQDVTLTVNDREFKAYIASTEQHRKRAINGLTVTDDRVIAMLYPELDDPIEIKFTSVPKPIELVFADAAGKVVLVQSVPAFQRSSFPRIYGGKRARVVLQLPEGTAKSLNITSGSSLKTSPDLVKQSETAEREFARVYFLRNEGPEDKPKESPFVSLKVLSKAEDVAQLMKDRDDFKDGEGVIVPISNQYHSFWLKGVKGKVCAAWIETTSSNTRVLTSIYEGIEAAGGSDLDEPVYYSSGKPAFLAIWKGADFFSKHKIDRRSPVTVIGVATTNHDAPDYRKIELKFGDETMKAELANTQDAREAALAKAPGLESGKAFVLAWDDPSHVAIDAPEGANLWFVGADGSIAHKQKTSGGRVDFKAQSRFALVLPRDFASDAAFKLPYLLQDLKPALPAVVFYSVRQSADVVTDRWPGEKDNFKARARVELAVTPAEQQRGLMFRESLRKDHGMLFIYNEEESNLSFWMKNCRMNLSIAFVDGRGVIAKIHNVMTKPSPGTPDGALERYQAGAMARYAIEMEENWFEKNGIKEGDRVFIPPALTEKK